VDTGEEVDGPLVVAGGDSAELLELAEKVFNEVAGRIQVTVERLRPLAVAFWRDGCGFAGRPEPVDHALVSIIGAIGQQRRRHDARQQHVAAAEVMRLAWRQVKAQRIAQRIDQGMDLRAQPASGRANGFFGTVFLAAPALCWCARTRVASIIAYSLSASTARA